MAGQNESGKEAFFSMAQAAGLDIQGFHVEELYRYVQDLLPPNLKALEELDLAGIEPAVVFVPSKECC